jgi:LPS sulfotransferase NodH
MYCSHRSVSLWKTELETGTVTTPDSYAQSPFTFRTNKWIFLLSRPMSSTSDEQWTTTEWRKKTQTPSRTPEECWHARFRQHFFYNNETETNRERVITYSRWHIDKIAVRETAGVLVEGKTEGLRGKPIRMPLCLVQIPHGLVWDRTGISTPIYLQLIT